MPNDLTVTPSEFEMATSETLPLSFDTTELLDVGETPSSPSCTLTDITNGANTSYTAGLSGSPSIDGNTIIQTVTALQAKHKYRLAVSFNADVGKIWTMELIIRCVF